MNFETLYYFMNEKQVVLEIKRTDLGDDVPKSEKYQWLSIVDSKITPLTFKSMREEKVEDRLMSIREFEEAELRFDQRFARFIHQDELHILMNCSHEKLPDNIRMEIERMPL